MTTSLPAFMPLALRWKPVGESHSHALENAYCLFEIRGAEAARIRRVVGEGSIASTEASHASLCLLARTDARGVVMTLPHGSANALDPLSLSALAPLLFPLGTRFSLWWTTDPRIFDDVQRARSQGASIPQHQAQLVFDAATDLPAALEALVVELEDGLELLPQLQRARRDAFPLHILELADDGRTWCIELQDAYLELAYDAAARTQHLMKLGEQQRLPAHQLLLAQVQTILRRRGAQRDSARDLIAHHARLCGTEYLALDTELSSVAHSCQREVQAASQALLKVYEQAFYELSVHPYPQGAFDRREPGAVSRRYAAKVILEATAVGLRDQVERKLYDTHEAGLEDRLLKIAKGEGDPNQADAAERLFAKTTEVISWLNNATSYVHSSVEAATAATDPKIAEPLTAWLEPILVAAARRKKVGTQALVSAVTRGMRMAQVWAGLEPNFEFELVKDQFRLRGTPDPRNVQVSLGPAARWNQRFERAGKLLKLLNVLSLADGMSKPDGEGPSVLKQMTDLHGFIEGLESSYRILTDTAQTELGVTLKGLGGLVGPIGLYLALDDTWNTFQAGSTLATQLAASALALGVLSMALELAVAAPHPAVKLLLASVGLVIAVATAYRYDDDETFLEQYRPGCGSTGAYAEARSAAKAMQRALDEAEWENQRALERADKLGA